MPAIDALTSSLTLHPDNLDAIKLRGSLYARLNLYSLALKDLDLALKAEPGNVELILARGRYVHAPTLSLPGVRLL